MKIIMLAGITALLLLLTGCNSGSTSSSRDNTVQPVPVQPVQPIQPVPVPPPTPAPKPGVPDVGVGSVNYQPSCDSGFATVVYVFRADSTIDTNSFIITHSVDGQRQNITTGSVYTNGSVSKMEEQVYIEPNDTDKQKAHQLRIDFISDGISQVNAFAFIQPTCATVDPEPDPDPVPPTVDIPMYAASTSYNVGDFVRVDKGDVLSTYRCVQAYTSGAGGGWTAFKTERVNWRWIKDDLPAMTIRFDERI